MTTPLILVTGSTGTVGREVVKQLVEGGHKVRALVRDPAKAKFDSSVEVVQGDLARPETLAAAFSGVDKAFVISNGPDLTKLETNAFTAAKGAGVKHVVKLSSQEAFQDHSAGAPLRQWIVESEQHLRGLGVGWTMLRPGYFASNIPLLLLKAEQGGVFLPAGDGKEAPIDPHDIAAVAVKVLTSPGHEGEIYELTGPELLSYAQMMEKISAVTGRPLRHVDVTEAETRDWMLADGFPRLFVDSLLLHFAAVKAGRITLASGVEDVLGRRARTFDDWAQANRAALMN